MGFLMRIAILMLGLLFAACSQSSFMDVAPAAGAWDWTQEGGNAQRNGARPQVLRTLVPAWDRSLSGYTGAGTPLLLGDLAFVPVLGGIVDILSLNSGEQVGRINTRWYIDGSPALAGERLLVAGNGSEATLQCYDVRSAALLWERRIDPVESAVCVDSASVYITTVTGRVQRYSIPDSSLVWTREFRTAFSAGPAAGRDVLLVTDMHGDMRGLALRDGAELWRHASGVAYVAGPMVVGDAAVAVNRAGALCIVDLQSGAVRASVSLGAECHVAPALWNGNVVVALADGRVLLLDARDGTTRHTWRTRGLPGATPVPAFDGLLLMQRDGTLGVLRRERDDFEPLVRVPKRSAMVPLLSERGVLLVDEEGTAWMFHHEGEGGDDER